MGHSDHSIQMFAHSDVWCFYLTVSVSPRSDTELCEGLFSLLLSLLSVDRDAAFSTSAGLLQSWPQLWPALASVPALLQPLLATEAARLLRLNSGPPLLDGLQSAGEPLLSALLARGAAGRRPLAALLLVSPAAKRAALAGQMHRRLTGQLRENIAALVTGSLSVRAARSRAKVRRPTDRLPWELSGLPDRDSINQVTQCGNLWTVAEV